MALLRTARQISGMLVKRAPLLATRSMSSLSSYNFENVKVSAPKEFVYNIEFNRPEKRNAFTLKMYQEIGECIEQVAEDKDCRVVIISGSGKMFSAGIDVMDLANAIMNLEGDVGRKGFFFRKFIKELQDWHTAIERCPKPVIASMHGACIGGGVDLVSACDIRYCTEEMFMQVKEVEVGLAADLGTLQRLPKIMGNDSLVRELCYTGRKMYADECLKHGFVSRVFKDKDTMMKETLDIASLISSKSPIAVQGSKVNLVYSRDHDVQSSLDYMSSWNAGMLQSEDLTKSATSLMTKETPEFSKL